jgi:hypothetical protein
MSHDVGECYCNDGSLVAALVFEEQEGLAVRALSEALGMGIGNYEQDLVPGHFDEVICYNSENDIAWVLLRRGNSLWRVKLSTVEKDMPVINVDPVISVDAEGRQWETNAMADVPVNEFRRKHHRATFVG